MMIHVFVSTILHSYQYGKRIPQWYTRSYLLLFIETQKTQCLTPSNPVIGGTINGFIPGKPGCLAMAGLSHCGSGHLCASLRWCGDARPGRRVGLPLCLPGAGTWRPELLTSQEGPSVLRISTLKLHPPVLLYTSDLTGGLDVRMLNLKI